MRRFIIFIFLASFLLLNTGLVQAGIVSSGLNTTEFSAYGKKSDESSVAITVGKIINVFLGLLGSIFVILILVGGFKWMTAQGNEEETAKAKSIIFRAVIGLIIILSAMAISRFVFEGVITATQ